MKKPGMYYCTATNDIFIVYDAKTVEVFNPQIDEFRISVMPSAWTRPNHAFDELIWEF